MRDFIAKEGTKKAELKQSLHWQMLALKRERLKALNAAGIERARATPSAKVSAKKRQKK